MEDEKEELEKRSNFIGENILKWFKGKENFWIFFIIAVSLLIRIYYFSLTYDQPIWWDEADYLNIAKSWLGTNNWDVNPLRPILFPLAICVLFLFGMGEIILRLLILLFSLAAIYYVYKVGELLLSKRDGLLAATFLAIFWSFLFYTQRILVDVPLAFLWLITIYTFFKGYFKNYNWKYFILPGFLLGLSFLLKFSSISLVAIFFIYLLITEKSKLFGNKRVITFYLTSLLTVIPYFIWQKVKFGSFLAFYTSAINPAQKAISRSFTQSLLDQIVFSTNVTHSILAILFVGGAILTLVSFLLLIDRSARKATPYNKNMFLILWLAISFIFFGWLNYGSYMDERYYFILYPAMFLLAAKFTFYLYDNVKKAGKILAIILVAFLICFAAYQNLSHADAIIESKKTSFEQSKNIGEWLDKNSDVKRYQLLLGDSAAMVYYSDRNYINDPATNITDVERSLQKYRPEYLAITLYSFNPSVQTPYSDLIYFIFSSRDIFLPVHMVAPNIPLNEQVAIPVGTIFKINNSYFEEQE